MTISWDKFTLNFKRPGGTSRGVLHTKDTYFLKVKKNEELFVGECNLFRGLSYDDRPDYETKLQWLCDNFTSSTVEVREQLHNYPSILFGWEQVQTKLKQASNTLLFPSEFTSGKDFIRINGLIWMGDLAFMKSQIKEKLNQGFSCLKLKIGALNWSSEHKLLQELRNEFTNDVLELRVDANGAFSAKEAVSVLDQLSILKVHSIEQPIKAGNWSEMADLCKNTPTPIALDEELIGVLDPETAEEMLETIQPQYIILKPALVGGFRNSESWIALAEKRNIGWWVTSALESNVGLNAIAQWAYNQNNRMPQGLGTGGLFTNNTHNLLTLHGDRLLYRG